MAVAEVDDEPIHLGRLFEITEVPGLGHLGVLGSRDHLGHLACQLDRQRAIVGESDDERGPGDAPVCVETIGLRWCSPS